jgi:type IV pilus assembly protein PilE
VRNKRLGFSLMELLLVLALVSVLLTMAAPTWRQHQLTAGRQQAWLQLQRIGLQQEMWFIQHGRYFEDISLVSPTAERLRYSYRIHLSDAGLLLSATVNPNGPQSHDVRCWQFTLSDTGEMKSLGKGGEIQVCK